MTSTLMFGHRTRKDGFFVISFLRMTSTCLPVSSLQSPVSCFTVSRFTIYDSRINKKKNQDTGSSWSSLLQ